MLLTLPGISPAIPAVMDFGTHGARHLRLALAMNRVGMVEQDKLASLRPSRFNSKALRHLIESNWMREVAPLFDFKVISAFTNPGERQLVISAQIKALGEATLNRGKMETRREEMIKTVKLTREN